jgi:hypothetical protein
MKDNFNLLCESSKVQSQLVTNESGIKKMERC